MCLHLIKEPQNNVPEIDKTKGQNRQNQIIVGDLNTLSN